METTAMQRSAWTAQWSHHFASKGHVLSALLMKTVQCQKIGVSISDAMVMSSARWSTAQKEQRVRTRYMTVLPRDHAQEIETVQEITGCVMSEMEYATTLTHHVIAMRSAQYL